MQLAKGSKAGATHIALSLSAVCDRMASASHMVMLLKTVDS